MKTPAGWIIGAAALAAFVAIVQLPVAGQARPAKQTKDGKPDLNGVWQALNTASWVNDAQARGRLRIGLD